LKYKVEHKHKLNPDHRLALLNYIFTLPKDEKKETLRQILDPETPLHQYLLAFKQSFAEEYFTRKEHSVNAFEKRIQKELEALEGDQADDLESRPSKERTFSLKELKKEFKDLRIAKGEDTALPAYAGGTPRDEATVPLLTQQPEPLHPVYLSTETFLKQFPSVPKEKIKKQTEFSAPKAEPYTPMGRHIIPN
jgi:hypothetical protein